MPKYDSVIHEGFWYDIKSMTMNNHWVLHLISKKLSKGLKQKYVKELKTIIKNITRNELQNCLYEAGIPVSWDTAFYVKYYAEINEGMKRVLIDLLEDFAGLNLLRKPGWQQDLQKLMEERK